MLDSTGGISVAQITFFIAITPPILYCLWDHGKAGLLGWFFLFTFCMLRIIGAGFVVNSQATGAVGGVGSIISQVALSPLFFAFCGIQHELSISAKFKRSTLGDWLIQIALHVLVSTGLALVVVGSTKFTSSSASSKDQRDGLTNLRVGIMLFLVCWLVLGVLTLISARSKPKSSDEKSLLTGLALSIPLLGLRVLYSVLGAFINSSSWNFLNGGTLAEKVVLFVIPEFLIIILFVVSGIRSRNLPEQRSDLSILSHQQRRSDTADYRL